MRVADEEDVEVGILLMSTVDPMLMIHQWSESCFFYGSEEEQTWEKSCESCLGNPP